MANKTLNNVKINMTLKSTTTRAKLSTSSEDLAVQMGKINKWYDSLVPTGGASGNILEWDSDGVAKWVTPSFLDEKVKSTLLAQSTAEGSYRPTFVTGAGTGGVNIIDSFKVNHTPGTTSAVGNTRLILGNATASGTANNEEGQLKLYSSGTSFHTLKGTTVSSEVIHVLPSTAGTILNDRTTTYTQTSSSSATGAYEIGKIKINGTPITIYGKDTNTTYTASDGIKIESNVIKHTNSIASAASVFKKISYDAQGHITGTDNVASGDIPPLDYVPTSMLTVTKNTNVGITPSSNTFGYVSGLTAAAWNFQQTDGTLFSQYYNDKWQTEIYMDYRTGQMSTRGKNNGTWQDWRIHLDSGNYTSYTVTKTGTGASGTWGISITGNAATATTASKLGTSTVGSGSRPIYLNAGTATQCDTPTSGAYWAGIPYVGSNGVMEIGKYIDFHGTNASTNDYDYRISAETQMLYFAPKSSGDATYNLIRMQSPDYNQIQFQTTKTGKAYTSTGIVVYPLTTSGQTMLIQSDGNTVVGGGESPRTLYSNSYDNMDTAENETLYLASDSSEIHLITNCQAYSGRKVLKVQDGQLVKTGGQWIAARDVAPVYTNKPNTQDGAYYPAWFGKTKSGGWSMGVLSHSDNLYITYTTDEDYSEGNNNNTYLIQFQNKSGTVALTSDIPTVPTVNNASLTLKGAGTTVTTFTANASTNQSLDIVAGSNVTITPDTTNHKITIASSYTNTDEKVNVTLGTTTKAYLLGTTTTPSSTAQGVTSIADTGVYLDTTAGMLTATTFKAGNTIKMNNSSGMEVTANTASAWARGIEYYVGSTYTSGIGGRGDANVFSYLYMGKYDDNIARFYQSDKTTYFYGTVHLKENLYGINPVESALNCHNSNITGINSLIFSDLSDNAGEGIMFYRSATPSWDVIWANSGLLHFTPNYPTSSDDLSIGFILTSSTTDAWSSIGVGLYSTERYQLKVIRTNGDNAYPSWMGWAYSAAIAFGGADTKGVISMHYSEPGVMFVGGQNDSNHTKPNWNFGISGTSGNTYNLNNFISLSSISATNSGSGNAVTSISYLNGVITATKGNSFLPLSGGTMSGTITHPANTVAINLRDDGTSTWQNTIMTQSAGDEAVVFANANARTSWMFVNGEDSIANHENNRWQSLTPALQIKGGCVAIGKLIPSGTTPTTKLDVAGNASISGTLYIDSKVAARHTATPVDGRIMIADGTTGGIKSSSYTIATSVPSGAVFTDTHVKVTSNTSTKAYLIATTTSPAGTVVEGVGDANVYLAATNHVLYTPGFSTTGSNKGYRAYDQAGTQYAIIYDNGSNLWVGAAASNVYHHKGQTYISSGWSGTLPTTAGQTLTGHSTIFISIPTYTATSATAGSWNHAPKYVLHSGNFTTTGSGNAITSVAFTNEQLTFTKGSTFSLSNHNHDSNYVRTAYNQGTYGTDYGILFTDTISASTDTGGYAYRNAEIRAKFRPPATSARGWAEIYLGNAETTNATGSTGWIGLYNASGKLTDLSVADGSSDTVQYFPNVSGTILNSGTTSFTRTLSSGTKIGTIKINGTSTDIYCETNTNTDTKVYQSSTTTSDFRPVLFGKNNQTNPENLETAVTDQAFVTKHIFAQPSTGNLCLYSTSGDSPALVFRRGTLIDNLNDWKIYVSSGALYFDQSTANASSETWTHKMYLHSSDGKLYVGSSAVSVEGHTHNYAGSSSAGGAATSANKLNTNAGSTTNPVYFTDGVPKACNKSASGAYHTFVPSVDSEGVMEVGAHIDFHSKTSTADYDLRLSEESTNLLALKSTSPTFRIHSTSHTNVALELWREGDNYTDYRIINTGGQFKIQSDYIEGTGHTDWFDMLHLAYTTGNATFKGSGTFGGIITTYRESSTTDNLPAGIVFSNKDTTTGLTNSGAHIYAYNDHANPSYGENLVINAGGCLFIGSGEAPDNHYAAIKSGLSTSEDIFITADGHVRIQGCGNAIAARKGMMVYTTDSNNGNHHEILPTVADTATNNVGSIGSSSYKWHAMYAANYYGEFDCSNEVPNNISFAMVLAADPSTHEPNTLRKSPNAVISFKNGTASEEGWAQITLGNETPSGTAGNSTGWLKLYSPSSGCHYITGASTTSAITHTLPTVGGTILNSGNYLQYTRSIQKLYAATSTKGWRRILTIPASNSSGYTIGRYEFHFTRQWNNGAPESFGVRVICNYTTPIIHLLYAEQYTRILTDFRVTRSSDSTKIHFEVWYDSTSKNDFSVRYIIQDPNLIPHDFCTFPTETNGSSAGSSFLPVVSDNPTGQATIVIPVGGISQFNLRQVTGSYGGYFGMADAAGSDSAWIRTTSQGLLPHQSGDGTSGGHCYLGTSGWYFANAYINRVYGNTADFESFQPRHSNEFNMKQISSNYIWLNYRLITDDVQGFTTNPTNPVNEYYFGCGKARDALAKVVTSGMTIYPNGANSGGYKTTLQSNSLTTNRTASLPDATGTIPLITEKYNSPTSTTTSYNLTYATSFKLLMITTKPSSSLFGETTVIVPAPTAAGTTKTYVNWPGVNAEAASQPTRTLGGNIRIRYTNNDTCTIDCVLADYYLQAGASVSSGSTSGFSVYITRIIGISY